MVSDLQVRQELESAADAICLAGEYELSTRELKRVINQTIDTPEVVEFLRYFIPRVDDGLHQSDFDRYNDIVNSALHKHAKRLVNEG